MGGKRSMRADSGILDMISSDLKDLAMAAKKLVKHILKLGEGFVGASLLEWLASFAAIYLLVLDRTNWRTNILTSLLLPYIFISLPSTVFSTLRGDMGKWIAFITMVLRLFFPRNFPDWLELPGALILLILSAPSLVSSDLRNSWVGLVICLGIGGYLLQQHIKASGGFKRCFTKSRGIANNIGIVLLVYPVCGLIVEVL